MQVETQEDFMNELFPELQRACNLQNHNSGQQKSHELSLVYPLSLKNEISTESNFHYENAKEGEGSIQNDEKTAEQASILFILIT